MRDPAASLRECVRRALAEDLGSDLDVAADVTSRLSVPAGLRGRVRILAKASGVAAGTACAQQAFAALDPSSSVTLRVADGKVFEAGTVLIEAEGVMRALLAAERTALNFLQRLCGVATLTRRFVDAVAGTRARILDTRKTTPGLRTLEKAAVVAGGGVNHRIGLFDQVLLKENHFRAALPVAYEDVVRRCVREQHAPVVAEARDLAEAAAAARGGAAVVLLDNFAPGAPLAAAVREVRSAAAGRSVLTEASGGVTLATVRAFADSGVDRISIGALTHSATAVDLSLLVEGIS